MFSVIVVGKSGVGKTSLIRTYTSDSQDIRATAKSCEPAGPPKYVPTFAMSYYSKMTTY